MAKLINLRVSESGTLEPDDRGAEIDRLREIIDRQRRALELARTAIFDTVRRPMGVVPDSANVANRAIDRALSEGKR